MLSSGMFLNHIHLVNVNVESQPFLLNAGEVTHLKMGAGLTPLPTDDWSAHMNSHSDGMQKLSLHEMTFRVHCDSKCLDIQVPILTFLPHTCVISILID